MLRVHTTYVTISFHQGWDVAGEEQTELAWKKIGQTQIIKQWAPDTWSPSSLEMLQVIAKSQNQRQSHLVLSLYYQKYNRKVVT